MSFKTAAFDNRIRIIQMSVLVLIVNSFGWRDGDMEVKLSHLNKPQLIQLRALNLRGDVWPDGSTAYATLYVTPDELNKLKHLGLAYTITIPNMKEQYKDFWVSQVAGFHSSGYHTYDRIIAIIDTLVKTHPSICAKISLGVSVQNRQLCMLKISNNVSYHENEAQLCFDGGIHGDEVGGPENLILFAQELCSKYGTDSLVTKLIDSREIFLYCMVNPDGRAAMTRENANGVDCNRDEGYMWSGANSPSVSSQPETKALRSAILSNRFSIQISYHSGTEEILYPWCYSGAAAPDKPHHVVLTNLYASTSGYGATLRNLQSYADYPTNGETIDMNYGTMGVAGFTFELSTAKQPADIAGYYNKNSAAMLKMIEYAGYGVEGTVLDSTDGAPVAAVVYCGSSFPCYSNPSLGDFHKFVDSGTYSLRVTANGYVTKTVDSIRVKKGASTVIPIRLQRDMQSKKCYGYKVVSVDNATGTTFSVLGPPDDNPCVLTGEDGMVIDMQDSIADAPGKDVVVRVSGTSSKYLCYAGQSPDGPWKLLGTSTKTDSFDLAQGPLENARYVKIRSSDCGLDAVEGAWKYDFQSLVKNPSFIPNLAYPEMTIKTMNGKMDLHIADRHGQALGVFDIRGRRCWTSPINGGRCMWQPAAKGVYALEISAGGRRVMNGRYVAK